MTIGIYSGSFDPIHTGHISLASWIATTAAVDQVWLLVSRRNPLKANPTTASDADRLAMARLASAPAKGVEVSDFEMSLPTPSFTYYTLCRLREAYPQHAFRLIIGSDNWHDFPKWRDYNRIISDFGILIYPRPDYPITKPLPPGVELIGDAPQSPASSTKIRRMLENGMIPGSALLSPAVADYIRSRRLYSASKK